MIAAAVLVIFPMCLAMAAFNDMLSMTIPNRLSVILIASFLLIAPLAGLSVNDMIMHFGAAAIVFVSCFALFAFGIMGGGDAKILTASALWFGFNQSLSEFIIYVSAFGGLLSVLVLTLRANSDIVLMSRLPVPQTLMQVKKVPYGIAIGAAALMVFPSAPIVKAVTGL